jgi:hypothetical protein
VQRGEQLLLHRVLRDETLPRRRLIDRGLRAGTTVLLARHVLDEDKDVRAVRQSSRTHLVFDTPLAKQLHGANPAPPRLRVVRCSRRFLDHDAIDLEAMQKQSHRKTDGTPADDEDGRG